MSDKIIIRPMYTTDQGFIKGWMCAVINSSGEVIARNPETNKVRIPDRYNNLEVEYLDYDSINWKLIGYDL